MKKLMMIAVMAIVALTANAQNTLRENGSFTLQPKLGLGLGIYSGDKEPGVSNKMRAGFLIGAEAEYYVNEWLGVAAGLNYAMQGCKQEAGGQTKTTKLDYLNIPITADFYVIPGLALKAGVQFGFLLSAKAESENIKSYCNKMNFSIPVGASYEYKNFVFDARYNIGLSNVSKKQNGVQPKDHSNLLQFTVGYKFQL